jgi:hypothetical protein
MRLALILSHEADQALEALILRARSSFNETAGIPKKDMVLTPISRTCSRPSSLFISR